MAYSSSPGFAGFSVRYARPQMPPVPRPQAATIPSQGIGFQQGGQIREQLLGNVSRYTQPGAGRTLYESIVPRQQTGTPPAAPIAPIGGGGGSAYNFNADFSADPILAQVQAYEQKVVAEAEAQALAQRKTALIDLGDPALAQQLIGDQGTAQAAGGNPFSTLARLAHAHEQQVTGLNEALNKANLFYSSTRGLGLGEEGRGYLQSQTDAQSMARQVLSQIAQQLAGTRQNAQEAILQAEQEAYMRALQQALAYYGPPGGGGPPSDYGSPSPGGGFPTVTSQRVSPFYGGSAPRTQTGTKGYY